MKRPNLNILFLFLLFAVFVTNAQVGINTTSPNAQLEIRSSDQVNPTNTDGLIIPKIDVFPSTNPTAAQQGMMVYLTTTNGLNTSGFYYWDNNALPSPKWVAIGSGSSSSGSFTHYIGELYGGGIVVAVWKESGVEKGLIASLVDIVNAPGIGWSGTTNVVVPISGATSLVDGFANTNAIISQNSTANKAATVCKSFNGGGFNDWYLPAIWELKQCFDAAFIVNTILGVTNGFKISDPYSYHSSTEFNANQNYKFIFTAGVIQSTAKSDPLLVRAVRRF